MALCMAAKSRAACSAEVWLADVLCSRAASGTMGDRALVLVSVWEALLRIPVSRGGEEPAVARQVAPACIAAGL